MHISVKVSDSDYSAKPRLQPFNKLVSFANFSLLLNFRPN